MNITPKRKMRGRDSKDEVVFEFYDREMSRGYNSGEKARKIQKAEEGISMTGGGDSNDRHRQRDVDGRGRMLESSKT